MSLEKLKARLIHPWIPNATKKHFKKVKEDTSFDARDFWYGFIQPVRDQGDCGSCWAFAVAESTTDRVSIEKYDAQPYFSPQDLVSCDTSDGGV